MKRGLCIIRMRTIPAAARETSELKNRKRCPKNYLPMLRRSSSLSIESNILTSLRSSVRSGFARKGKAQTLSLSGIFWRIMVSKKKRRISPRPGKTRAYGSTCRKHFFEEVVPKHTDDSVCATHRALSSLRSGAPGVENTQFYRCHSGHRNIPSS